MAKYVYFLCEYLIFQKIVCEVKRNINADPNIIVQYFGVYFTFCERVGSGMDEIK